MIKKVYNSVLIVGLGLIGSSLVRALKEQKLSRNICGLDINKDNIKKCEELGLLNKGFDDLNHYSNQFDLVIICVPLGAYKNIFKIVIYLLD